MKINLQQTLKRKLNFLIYFTANQCTLLNNSSVLLNNLAKLTNESLDTVNFSTDDISKIISNLDINKAHGYDMLSIRMIKLCRNSTCKPLSIFFNGCLKEGKFPSDWKKAHVVPVHKRGNKQCLKNYRPTSLLPICGKIFERFIYKELFTFVSDNNLLALNHSGFRSGYSCVNQLTAITHEIYKPLDDGLEVREIFLDISKAFDKVWYKWYLWKPVETFMRFSILSQITSSFKCIKFILREFQRRGSSRLYFRTIIVSNLH